MRLFGRAIAVGAGATLGIIGAGVALYVGILVWDLGRAARIDRAIRTELAEGANDPAGWPS